MSLLDLYTRKKSNTASMAKERLQVIVSHARGMQNQPEYMPLLQQDILNVIRKYIEIDMDQVDVQLEHEGNTSVLELNVTLPN